MSRNVNKVLPVLDRAKELFSYDLESGAFTWKASKQNPYLIGKPAGTKHNDGYLMIRIDGQRYRAHRLAWAWVHGEEPPVEIDHIDRDRLNNSIDNLRAGVGGTNQMNVPSRSASGVVGVFFDKARGRYLSSMGKKENHQRLYWGKDFFEAVCARKSAENQFWATV